MSNTKFTITKHGRAWILGYPDGFDSEYTCLLCPTFTDAVAEFITASESQCPQCLRGTVIDTDTGWKCTACGTYDIATVR